MDEPQARLRSLLDVIRGSYTDGSKRQVTVDRVASLERFLLGSNAPPQAVGCGDVKANNPLVGAGQLTIFVCTRDYAVVEKALRANRPVDKSAGTATDTAANTFDASPQDQLPTPHLILNGFDLGEGGEHLSTEPLSTGYTALRYRLVPDKDSDKAWATLYRERGFTQTVNLRPALAWNGQAVFRSPPALAPPVEMAVTRILTLVEAVVVAVIFEALFLWAMYRTDIFRDSPALPWWDEADLLRGQVRAARLGKKARFKFLSRDMKGIHAVKSRMAGMDYWAKGSGGRLSSRMPAGWHAPMALAPRESAAVMKVLRNSSYGGVAFSQSQIDACLEWADKAVLGNYPEADADVAATVIGLALTNERWKPVRGAFSLASVQVGVWMMFACIAAVFLWVVYGALPAIVGSLLGLVSITVVISGASWIVDPASKKFLESQGLWRDLMMGADGQAKVHRFQAVLVNLLLLFVGTGWLFKNLTYPTFDDTWLQFLGLSGLAQTVGKAVNEGTKPGA